MINEIPENNENNLFQLIKETFESHSSGRTIFEIINEPRSTLVYHHILNLSTSKMLGVDKKNRFGRSFIDLAITIRNPLIMSAFLQKNVVDFNQTPISEWIHKNIKEKDLNYYQKIYYILSSEIEDKINFDMPHHNHFVIDNALDIIFDIKNPAKQEEILLKFIQKNKKPDLFFSYIERNIKLGNIENMKKIIYCCKLKNIDLFKFNLNYMLPKSENGEKFFISSNYNEKIISLLNVGFSFDDKNYYHNGNNLFMSVIDSKRSDLYFILPHCSNLKSKKLTYAEQDDIVSKSPEICQNYYNPLRIKLNAILLQEKIEQLNPTIEDSKKNKI